jgi:hypothetical protein
VTQVALRGVRCDTVRRTMDRVIVERDRVVAVVERVG